MANASDGPSVPLVEYAAAARIGYFAALNRILRGEVVGWKDQRGHWRVSAIEVAHVHAAGVTESEE